MRCSLSVVRSAGEDDREPGHGRGPAPSRRGPGCGSGGFLGPDVARMSPGARVAAALAVLSPVALSGVFLLVFVPQLWWIFTTYGWISFPAFGLLASGLGDLAAERTGKSPASVPPGGKERELLKALKDYGELTPARAAMETSLTVAEADRRLRELAEGGHLEVRVRGGGLFYSLWGSSGDALEAPQRSDYYREGEI